MIILDRLFFKKANLVNELNNLSGDHNFNGNYPIKLININKTRMKNSNMRKSNRSYACKNCLKEFDVREGEDRYRINFYDTILNPAHLFILRKIQDYVAQKNV